MKLGIRRPGYSIRTTLFTSYVLVCLPLLIVTLYFARAWSEQEHSLLAAQSKEMGMRAGHRVQDLLEQSGETLMSIARFPGMGSQDPEEVSSILVSLLPLNPFFADIALTDMQGLIVSRASGPALDRTWIGDRPYFQRAQTGQKVVVSESIEIRGGNAKNMPGFAVAVPFRNADGQQAGMLVASLRAADVGPDILPNSTATGLSIFVLDQTNHVVLSGQEGVLGQQLRLADGGVFSLQAGSGMHASVVDPVSGQIGLTSSWPIGDTGWTTVAIEPRSVVESDVQQRLGLIAAIVLAAAALSLGCAFLLGGRLSRRIARVAEASALISQGRLGVQVPVNGTGEVVTLLRAFNTMSARLSEMFGQLEETRLSLRRAYKDVARALTTGFNTKRSLDLLLRVAMTQLGVQAALVGRVEDEGRSLRWIALSGRGYSLPPDSAIPLSIPHFLAARAVQADGVTGGTDPSLALKINVETGAVDLSQASALAAPLHGGGRVAGAIQVFGQDGRVFSKEEKDTLRALASAASIALDKAALFAESERQKRFTKDVLDSVPAAVGVVKCPDWIHEMANPAYGSMIGMEIGDFVNKPPRELASSPVWLSLIPAIQAAAVSGDIQRLDDIETSRDGSPARHWSIICAPLPDSTGAEQKILITGVETTIRVAAQQEAENLARVAERHASQLETVISSMAEGVIVADTDGDIVMVNEVGRQIMADFPVPVHAADHARLTGPRYPNGDSVPTDKLPRVRAARGERFTDTEIVMKSLDGRDAWFSFSGAPLLDDRGQPRGGVCVYRDVTEEHRRRVREQLLAEVSELFNSTMNVSEVLELIVRKTGDVLGDWCAIYVLDESGRALRMSAIYHEDAELLEKARKLLGGRALPLSSTFISAVVLKGKPQLIERLSVKEARQYGGMLRELARSKNEVATSCLSVPLRARGHILGALAVTCTGGRHALDASDLSFASELADRAAVALDNARLYQRAESERARLQSIIDGLPEGIVVAEGATGCISLCNCVAETMWGRPITPGTIVSELAEALVIDDADQDQMNRSYELFDTLATGQAVFSREIAVHRPDGSVLTLLASSAPFCYENSDTRGMVAVFQDISRIKEIERLKDEFLSITSHELRTPLTSLKGFAQILLRKAERTPGRDDDAQALQVINRQINRMTALVRDLLDVSRLQAGQLPLARGEVDLVSLAHRVSAQVQGMTSRHRLEVRAVEPSLWGYWDERRIEQVVTNLLDNAVKYSEEGRIELSVYRQGDKAVVSVHDNGVGLSRDNQSRVFQRFFRGGDISTRHVGGLGLGLYICDQLVGSHGGYMWVESEEGRGSTFSFALPVSVEGDLVQHQGGRRDEQHAEGVDCRR